MGVSISVGVSVGVVNLSSCPGSFADPSMWAVHVGVTEQPVHGAQSVAVERIVYHAKYRPKGLDYDVALMKLSTPLQFNGNHACHVAMTTERAPDGRPPTCLLCGGDVVSRQSVLHSGSCSG